jgi:protein-tyrosine phosphatase
MDIAPDRHVAFDRLHNFRDFGGYPAAGGRRVRRGRLYRSDSLGKLGGPDTARFAAIGVRTVIDLRYPSEAERGGRVPASAGLAYHNCSIEHRPYDQAQMAATVDPVRFLADRYAEVAQDGVAEIGRALDIIAAAGSAPLVIHCASGKDRTGVLAAIVLSLLGVAPGDIAADFALTELATSRLIADWHAFYPGRELVWPFYGRAPAPLMQLFLTELDGCYGSVRDYVTGYLGLPEGLIGDLGAAYLEPADLQRVRRAPLGGRRREQPTASGGSATSAAVSCSARSPACRATATVPSGRVGIRRSAPMPARCGAPVPVAYG